MVNESDGSMKHLHPSAFELLGAPDKERIRFVREAKWITYPKAAEALELLEDIWEHPPHHRMPCALIWGDTNNGKTLLSHRFARMHPPNDNPEGENVNVPVFTIQMPAEPTMKGFLVEILRAGFADYPARATAEMLKTNVISHLKVCQTRILVIDEFHNVLGITGFNQRAFLALIRYLTNELQLPIVCFGTKKALLPFRVDEQLSNRFRKFELPPWRYDRNSLRYLNSLERLLPLRKTSKLVQPALAKRLVTPAINSIGEITDFVKLAAIQAIKDGTELIDVACLEKCGYIPPNDHRRRPPPNPTGKK